MEKYLYQDLYNLEGGHWWHIAKRRIVFNLAKSFLKIKNPKIIDIGCGTGKNLEQLSKIGTAWGVDNSKAAINFCKRRGLKKLRIADGENTDFPTNFFDLATSLDVLEHTDDNQTLKEIHRILKKDGLVIITVPAFSWLWSKWDVVLHHQRRYTKKSLIKMLTQNKFKIVKISYMYSFLVIPALLIRPIKSLFYQDKYPSDFKLSSSPIDWLLDKIANIETFLILKTLIPIGTSLVVVAQKNEK